MAWETLAPLKGARVSARNAEAVTVAWRVSAAATIPRLVVTMSRPLSARLGWVRGDRVSFALDREAGLLRIQPVASGGYGVGRSGENIQHMVPLPHVKMPTQTAEVAAHEVIDGAVIITLPGWAAPERAAPERAAAEREAEASARAMTGAERARQEALARVAATVEAREQSPAKPRQAYTGIMSRVPDPNVGRRMG